MTSELKCEGVKRSGLHETNVLVGVVFNSVMSVWWEQGILQHHLVMVGVI